METPAVAASDAVTCTSIESPLGPLLVSASERGLTGLYFERYRHGPRPVERAGWMMADQQAAHSAIFAAAEQQLGEYFAHQRTEFDLPLDPRGTAFQLRVWTILRTIPYGATMSYLDLARRLGDPRATRAVGSANGRNPISIVIPCHRVIGAHGDLVGFGGGLERKRLLLEHEDISAQGRLALEPRVPHRLSVWAR
jgi:methylated-DNA-[protein]-cysteine S-methyltransferase